MQDLGQGRLGEKETFKADGRAVALWGGVVVVVVEEQVHRPWGFPCQECSRSCKEAGVAGAE